MGVIMRGGVPYGNFDRNNLEIITIPLEEVEDKKEDLIYVVKESIDAAEGEAWCWDGEKAIRIGKAGGGSIELDIDEDMIPLGDGEGNLKNSGVKYLNYVKTKIVPDVNADGFPKYFPNETSFYIQDTIDFFNGDGGTVNVVEKYSIDDEVHDFDISITQNNNIFNVTVNNETIQIPVSDISSTGKTYTFLNIESQVNIKLLEKEFSKYPGVIFYSTLFTFKLFNFEIDAENPPDILKGEVTKAVATFNSTHPGTTGTSSYIKSNESSKDYSLTSISYKKSGATIVTSSSEFKSIMGTSTIEVLADDNVLIFPNDKPLKIVRNEEVNDNYETDFTMNGASTVHIDDEGFVVPEDYVYSYNLFTTYATTNPVTLEEAQERVNNGSYLYDKNQGTYYYPDGYPVSVEGKIDGFSNISLTKTVSSVSKDGKRYVVKATTKTKPNSSIIGKRMPNPKTWLMQDNFSSPLLKPEVIIHQTPSVHIGGASRININDKSSIAFQGNSDFIMEGCSQVIIGSVNEGINYKSCYNPVHTSESEDLVTVKIKGSADLSMDHYSTINMYGESLLQMDHYTWLKMWDKSAVYMTGKSSILLYDETYKGPQLANDYKIQENEGYAAPGILANPQQFIFGSISQGQGSTSGESEDRLGPFCLFEGKTSVKIGDIRGRVNIDIKPDSENEVKVVLQHNSFIQHNENSIHYMFNDSFFQQTGNSHQELHDNSRLIMRGHCDKPWLVGSEYDDELTDGKWTSPIQNANGPLVGMYGAPTLIMREEWNIAKETQKTYETTPKTISREGNEIEVAKTYDIPMSSIQSASPELYDLLKAIMENKIKLTYGTNSRYYGDGRIVKYNYDTTNNNFQFAISDFSFYSQSYSGTQKVNYGSQRMETSIPAWKGSNMSLEKFINEFQIPFSALQENLQNLFIETYGERPEYIGGYEDTYLTKNSAYNGEILLKQVKIEQVLPELDGWTPETNKVEGNPFVELIGDADLRMDKNGITINGVNFTNNQLEALKELL